MNGNWWIILMDGWKNKGVFQSGVSIPFKFLLLLPVRQCCRDHRNVIPVTQLGKEIYWILNFLLQENINILNKYILKILNNIEIYWKNIRKKGRMMAYSSLPPTHTTCIALFPFKIQIIGKLLANTALLVSMLFSLTRNMWLCAIAMTSAAITVVELPPPLHNCEL